MRALKVLKETLEELVKGYSRALSEHDWSESTRAWGEGVIKGLETAIEVVEIALAVEARFATDGGNEECGGSIETWNSSLLLGGGSKRGSEEGAK